MKDLDFDELDRAVSSLLSDTAEKAVSTPEASPMTSDASVASPSVTPVAAAVVAPAEDKVAGEPKKKALVEKRSSGRFMDVMHPSSDMKSTARPAVSRQAATLQPPTTTPAAAEEVTPEVTKEPLVNEEEVTVASASTLENDASLAEEATVPEEDEQLFPDPLDFHKFSVEETSDTSEQVAEETPNKDDHHDLALAHVTSELNELNGLIEQEQADVSVDTPFVNGLSLEKRPLGAFSVDASDTSLLTVEPPTEPEIEEVVEETVKPELTDEQKEAIANLESKDAQTPAAAEVVPEELQGDVVAVEAAGVDVAATPPPAASIGTGSIPQQYTEKERPVSEEATPIFDTTQYHQPLKHTPKQKSGWLGTFLIILIILLGIGAGAAVYFFDPFGLF